jgi:hypothetical protein
MEYEIGHTNFSVKSDEQHRKELAAHEAKLKAVDEGCCDADEDDMPVVRWHKDSYPFVCVLMLSDASTMIGGETALKTGTGEILKIRGPQMVS